MKQNRRFTLKQRETNRNFCEWTSICCIVNVALLVGVFLSVDVESVVAQLTDTTNQDSSRIRKATLSAGIGNTYGWFGLTGEYYFLESRLSLVGGLGYTPDDIDEGGVAVALATRWYHGNRAHRFFLEASLSELSRASWYDLVSGDFGITHNYGPGVSGGLQYTSNSGFNLLIGAGAGLDINNSELVAILNVGAGYTWWFR